VEIGNIIKPKKESGFFLRSGAESYDMAVVISLDPFIITSEESDMRWQTTVKEEDFEVVGLAEKQVLENCKRRLNN
jgi:hypothetical protein